MSKEGENPQGKPSKRYDPERVTSKRCNPKGLRRIGVYAGYPRFCSCRQNKVDAEKVTCIRHVATPLLTPVQRRRADAVGRKLAHDPRLKTVNQVLSAVREALT
jgi:hypothetical protein